MLRKMAIIIPLMPFVLLLSAGLWAEDYTQWPYSRPITINTKSTGANVANTVKKIPILIRLKADTAVFNHSKPAGQDIRFSKNDSVSRHLPYQIERWDPANKVAEIWVLPDSVKGNDSIQYLRMYWGNAGAADSSKSTAVFDVANGYIGVWHLGESPSGAAGSIKDATGNGLHATPKNMTSADSVDGVIGKAHAFNGGNAGDSIPYKPALNTANAVTLSAWVNVTSFNAYSRIVSRGMPRDSTPWSVYSLNTHDTLPRMRGEISAGADPQTTLIGKSALSKNTWYYVAMTYDKSNMRMYNNGALDTSFAASIAMTTAQTTPLMIGKPNFGTITNSFHGIIDEVSVSSTARSADWILLSYKNQMLGSSTVGLGPVTISPPSSVSYKNNQLICYVNSAIAPDTASVAGLATAWTISPQLPAGLILNTSNGIISGTPTDTSSKKDYIIAAGSGAVQAFDTISITVNPAAALPIISAQSISAWVAISNTAGNFWLKAESSGTLTYQWTKNGSIISNSNAKDTLKLDTIKRTDNLAVYQCKVVNAAGLSVTSSPCTLHVVAAIFGAKPLQGNDTLTVAFSDSSIGSSAAASMSWKLDFGDGSAPVTNPNTPHFYIRPDVYNAKLIVSSHGVSDSMIKSITVNKITLQAGFKPSVTVSTLPQLSVTFTDTSKGTIYYREWNFGDGSVVKDTGNRGPVTHAYTQYGIYTVSLVVSGPAGSSIPKSIQNCILMYNPSTDTTLVKLTGQFKSSNSITVIFSNYAYLHDSAPAPYVNKVELWGKKDTLPKDTTATKLGSYVLSTLKNSGSQCTTQVSLTATYLPSDSVGLLAVVLWNTGARSRFLPFNGTYVSMRDTIKPVNTLAITAVYQGDSTVKISLDNVSTLDSVKTPSISIEYDLNDSTFPNSRQFEVSTGLVLRSMINNSYPYFITDARFIGAQRTVYCAVSLKSAGAIISARKIVSIQVGSKRPDNTIVLKATASPLGNIKLQWQQVVGIDSIRIWYSSQKAIPVGRDFVDPQLSSFIVPLTISDTLMSGLEPKTKYYFGAQVAVNKIWSYVTDSSSANATTVPADTTIVVNTVKVDTALYDSAQTRILVVVSVDTSGYFSDTLEAKVTWATTNATDVDSAKNSPVWPTYPSRIIRPLDTLTIDLKVNILFETKYYLGVWLRKRGALWASPTDSSRYSLMTPSFNHQAVQYGQKEGVSIPVAYADNKKFRITIDTSRSNNQDIDANTIYRSSKLPPIPQGFIPLSVGYEFGSHLSPGNLYIAIKYDPIPANHTSSEVRIYRYDYLQSLWFLDRTPLSYDNGYVSVFTKMIDNPFIAMIDTAHPIVIPYTDTAAAVAANLDVMDSFSMSDNIANVQWRFLVAKGGNDYELTDTGRFNTYAGSIATLMEAGVVSADQGVRGILIVDDGTHSDTVNISRRVIRQSGSDVLNTAALKWTPLRVTAFLDKPQPPFALKSLAGEKEWKYDITQFRLFRWYPYSGNASQPDSNKWVEYSNAADSLFAFVPGNVTWIKTLNQMVIDFGKSVTPSLKQAQSITLKPGAWTDIALPFHFDIKIGDIFDASPDSLRGVDGLHIIGWKREKDSAAVSYEDVYWPLNTGDMTTALLTQQNNSFCAAYSIYNPLSRQIALKVPPLPVAMSKYSVQKRASKTGSTPWVFKVTGRINGFDAASSVLCVFREGKNGKRYYPAAPFLGGPITVSVRSEEDKQYGYAVYSGDINKDGGASFGLALQNPTNKTESIGYEFESVNGLPRGMRMALIDPAAGSLENLSGPIAIGVDAGGRVARLLVVGNETYLAKAKASAWGLKLSLVGVYPNPFKRSIRIRYTVPFTGLQSVKFAIFNPSGREIWNAVAPLAGKVGPQEYLWNGKSKSKAATAAGMYIVRMTAFNPNGAISGLFEKKIMYLP